MPKANNGQPTLHRTPKANNLQPWPIGHATRTTVNLQQSTFNSQPSTVNLGQ
ncbi:MULTISPECIES: hypothetical protein [unclassified Moorena]|uniref:hypothetical protein n=1 Tax=unclassified Moorena TaxID=2683338 RepID=UPI0013FF7476|nr:MULTISPECIES: hypothetical protein [unclassified Moorena]NEO15843.1 hypothetical protein [Moorena sp. SIO3E8]NEQ02262.1 hypothetical protein [Moorena sp. SIO3F7]